MNIQNLSSYDPFADLGDESKSDANQQAVKKQQTQNYVHIRIQQRNGRKTLTTLQGLPKGMFSLAQSNPNYQLYSCIATLIMY